MAKKRDDVFIGLSVLFVVVVVLILVSFLTDLVMLADLWLGVVVSFLFTVLLGYPALYPARFIEFNEWLPFHSKKKLSKKQRAFSINFYRILFMAAAIIILIFFILMLVVAIGVSIVS